MIRMPIAGQGLLMVAQPSLAHVESENFREGGRIGRHRGQRTAAHEYTTEHHHLTQSRFDGHFRYYLTQRRQFVVLIQTFHLSEQHLGFDDGVQWRRLDGFAQEVTDRT